MIANGDFTTLSNGPGQITTGAGITTAADWTTTGYNVVMSVADVSVPTQYGRFALWDAANGGASSWNGLSSIGASSNFLALDGDFRTAKVSQTVSGLTVGKTYDLAFDYGFSQQTGFTGPTTQSLDVFVGGATPAWTSPTEHLASHGFAGWTSARLTFKATSASEVVSFLAAGSPAVPPFALVSDVSLTAVPESSTWAMMLAGFAGLGYAGFRSARGKAASVA